MVEAGPFIFWILIAAAGVVLAVLGAALCFVRPNATKSESTAGGSTTDAALKIAELEAALADSQAAEARQAELVARMATANHAAGIVMWHCDLKARMLYSLPGVTAIWGGQPFSIDEFEARFVHPDDLDEYRKVLYAVGVDVDCIEHRYRAMLPDGQILHTHVHARAVRSASGRLVGIVGAQWNVTTQVQAAQFAEQQARDLLDMQQRFMRATKGTQDALVEMEFSTGAVWTAPRLNEMLGYELAESVGITRENFHDFVHPDDRDGISNPEHLRILYAGLPYENEYRLRKRDGSYLWVRYRGRSELSSAGMPIRTSGSVQDITVERAARAAKEAAIQAAESANRAKSTFLATVSHEIRTPLNGIIGMATLLMDTGLDRVQHDYADTVRSSADSLLAILNDILDFSKIEAGKLTIEELEFDVHEQVDAVGALLAFTAARKGIELVVNVHPDVPLRVCGDPQRLRQCLLNLAGNAIKFTQQGEVSILVRALDDALRFEVHDSGIGISSDALNNLFQPFVQAEAATSRKFGGTGLGLSIVRRLAELMGGEVGADSTLGRGSQFWLQLPLRSVSLPRVRVEEFPALDRVLCVDANTSVRSMLALQLRSLGYEPETAADLEQAAALLAGNCAQSYAALLIDYRLIRACSGDLWDNLRVEQALASTRAIALTRVDDIAEMHDIAARGFAAYVSKPCKQRELAACLERVLRATPDDITAGTLVQSGRAAESTLHPCGRILLVEDNPVNQRVALKFLERLGCSADAVGDGEAAVAHAAEHDYALILMDMQLPGIDGPEAARRIRAVEPAGRRVPIVALTANVMQEQIRECREAGMDDHLAKPLDVERLRAMLERFATVSSEPRAKVGST